MLGAVRFGHTKNPRPGETTTRYAMFDLEDAEGSIRSILWPGDFARYGSLVAAGRLVAARGYVDRRPGSEETNLIVQELIPLAELPNRLAGMIRIRLDEGLHGEEHMAGLRAILDAHRGRCEVQLEIALADGTRVLCTCDGLRAAVTGELRSLIEELLGEGRVQVFRGSAPRAPAPKSAGREPWAVGSRQ
jgi:DNA polymerase-3 subunit alpha